MKERWFTLTDRGHNMVAAGLLRDRLFEQAIEKIEDMLAQRVVVQDWLLDKAIWLMLDYGEVEEAWNLLAERESEGRTAISGPLWMQILDVSAKMCFVSSAGFTF
jgi:6-phosphogluconate dehydrogenase (decarboxylating)